MPDIEDSEIDTIFVKTEFHDFKDPTRPTYLSKELNPYALRDLLRHFSAFLLGANAEIQALKIRVERLENGSKKARRKLWGLRH